MKRCHQVRLSVDENFWPDPRLLSNALTQIMIVIGCRPNPTVSGGEWWSIGSRVFCRDLTGELIVHMWIGAAVGDLARVRRFRRGGLYRSGGLRASFFRAARTTPLAVPVSRSSSLVLISTPFIYRPPALLLSSLGVSRVLVIMRLFINRRPSMWQIIPPRRSSGIARGYRRDVRSRERRGTGNRSP